MNKQKIKNSTWVRLPLELLTDYHLTPTEAIIASLCIDNGELEDEETLVTAISKHDIAEKLSISERTVSRAMQKLEYAGIVFPIEQESGTATKYRIEMILPPKQYQIEILRKRSERNG